MIYPFASNVKKSRTYCQGTIRGTPIRIREAEGLSYLIFRGKTKCTDF